LPLTGRTGHFDEPLPDLLPDFVHVFRHGNLLRRQIIPSAT
jgi:hypothetical protein